MRALQPCLLCLRHTCEVQNQQSSTVGPQTVQAAPVSCIGILSLGLVLKFMPVTCDVLTHRVELSVSRL